MNKYEVDVCRTSYTYYTMIVEADSLADAKSRALELAPELDFGDEADVSYSIEGALRCPDITTS